MCDDYNEGYNAGYDSGFETGLQAEQNSAEMEYNSGQVAMRHKCLRVIRQYYGDSVYQQLLVKLNEISLEE